MEQIFQTMLNAYAPVSVDEKKNAAKEIVQEIVLCGLSRAGFFEKAAFYGGTALRIFYHLNRFSEDLDFSLQTSDSDFNLSAYLPTLEQEIQSFGLNMTIMEKQKTVESPIQSAFLKGDTQEHLMLFFANDDIHVISGEKIKVKLEIDTDPAPGASFEQKYRLLPSPYQICLYDQSSLFAGKIHAILCRGWKNRIKGRDLYDYVFYLSRSTPVNLIHLNAKLQQTGFLQANQSLDLQQLKASLCDKFASINYTAAKTDVMPFISDKNTLDIWSAEFFCSITDGLTIAS